MWRRWPRSCSSWLASENQLERSVNDGDLEGVFEVIVALSFLPALVLVVGLGVAFAVRLRWWWVVGLVAPILCLVALDPLSQWPVLRAVAAVAAYTAVGAASTALANR